jgi:hypothetical protein
MDTKVLLDAYDSEKIENLIIWNKLIRPNTTTKLTRMSKTDQIHLSHT